MDFKSLQEFDFRSHKWENLEKGYQFYSQQQLVLKVMHYWTWTKIGHVNLNIQLAEGMPQQVNGKDCGIFFSKLA